LIRIVANDSLKFNNIITIDSDCLEGVRRIKVFKLYIESQLTRHALDRKYILDDSIISLVRTRLDDCDAYAEPWVLVKFEEMASSAYSVYCV
jgi:hypothetical protein